MGCKTLVENRFSVVLQKKERKIKNLWFIGAFGPVTDNLIPHSFLDIDECINQVWLRYFQIGWIRDRVYITKMVIPVNSSMV
jgi:hypothetical protein